MTSFSRLSIPRRRLAAGLALALLLAALAAVIIANSAAPSLNLSLGEMDIDIRAERAWSLYPGDCPLIQWQLEGIQALYIDGKGEIGSGEKRFCPQINRASPLIEVVSADGIYRVLQLHFHYLPDLLLYLAAALGWLGAILLASWFLLFPKLALPLPRLGLLLALLLMAVLGLQLRLSPPALPSLDADEGDVQLHLWASQERLIFPLECVELGWSVIGAKSLRVNGTAVDPTENPGQARHCDRHGSSAQVVVEAQDGAIRTYDLPIPALFAPLAHLPLYYYLCLLGWLLGALVFVPLALEKARAGVAKTELIAMGALAFLAFMLFLPFGFDSIPQAEQWYGHAYIDGQAFDGYAELFGRPWLWLAQSLAKSIAPDSFRGLHIMHMAILAANMGLVYAITRKLKLRALHAFLLAALIMLYPVNDGLLTPRGIGINASTTFLLLALFAALDYQDQPRRLTLAGMLLALMFHFVIYEASLALLLVLPLLFWRREPGDGGFKRRLSLCWLLPPAFKLAYMALLYLTGRPFYSAVIFDPENISLYVAPFKLDSITEVLALVYKSAFVDGWLAALAALGEREWLLPALIALAALAGASIYLARRDRSPPRSPRQHLMWLLGGALAIVPAVGVMMWFTLLRGGDWRLFLYVPFGGGLAVFSLLLLLTARLGRPQLRDAVLITLCLLLMLPALMRLYAQHDRLVRSADAKARILLQVLEIVPSPAADAKIVVMTDLSYDELAAAGIAELAWADIIDSAMYTLYGEDAPRGAYFCLGPNYCTRDNAGDTVFAEAAAWDALHNTLLLELDAEHKVRLVADPLAYFELDLDINYDISRLYDKDAPLPARARTMLASVYRG